MDYPDDGRQSTDEEDRPSSRGPSSIIVVGTRLHQFLCARAEAVKYIAQVGGLVVGVDPLGRLGRGVAEDVLHFRELGAAIEHDGRLACGNRRVLAHVDGGGVALLHPRRTVARADTDDHPSRRPRARSWRSNTGSKFVGAGSRYARMAASDGSSKKTTRSLSPLPGHERLARTSVLHVPRFRRNFLDASPSRRGCGSTPGPAGPPA